MDNQHKKIKGYRDLSQEEIDLMNEIKQHAEQTKQLLEKVVSLRNLQGKEIAEGESWEERFKDGVDKLNESFRYLDLAKQNLQQGYMWAVRSVALPDSF